MKWISLAVIVILAVVIFLRDDEVIEKDRPLPTAETSERVVSRKVLRGVGAGYEKLSDEDLWEGILDAWEKRGSDSRRIAMLLRELGKRHGVEALAMLDELGAREGGDDWGQARAAVFGGWGTIDPAAAGRALLTDLEVTVFLDGRVMRYIGTPKKFAAYQRVAVEVFEKWGREDELAAGAALEELKMQTYPEVRLGALEGLHRGNGRLIAFDLAKRDREVGSIVKSDVESPEAKVVEKEGGVEAILREMRTPADWRQIFQGESSREKDLSGKELFNISAALQDQGPIFLQNWAERQPEEAARHLGDGENFSLKVRSEMAFRIAQQQPDYSALVGSFPVDERVDVMRSLLRLSSEYHAEQVWPVDAGSGDTWTVPVTERREQLEIAIRQGGFDDTVREQLLLELQDRVSRD